MQNYTLNKLLFAIVVLIFAFAVLSSIGNAQSLNNFENAKPKEISGDLIRIANKIEASKLSPEDKDMLAMEIEALSAYLQEKYQIGSLCGTDLECFVKFAAKPRPKRKRHHKRIVKPCA